MQIGSKKLIEFNESFLEKSVFKCIIEILWSFNKFLELYIKFKIDLKLFVVTEHFWLSKVIAVLLPVSLFLQGISLFYHHGNCSVCISAFKHAFSKIYLQRILI